MQLSDESKKRIIDAADNTEFKWIDTVRNVIEEYANSEIGKSELEHNNEVNKVFDKIIDMIYMLNSMNEVVIIGEICNNKYYEKSEELYKEIKKDLIKMLEIENI